MYDKIINEINYWTPPEKKPNLSKQTKLWKKFNSLYVWSHNLYQISFVVESFVLQWSEKVQEDTWEVGVLIDV